MAKSKRPDGSPKTAATGRRIVSIGLASVAGTAALLTVIVLLTPLDDATDPTGAQGASSTVPMGREVAADSDRSSRAPNPASNSLSKPRLEALVFPSQPEPIDVGELQTELRALAERLQRDYPSDSAAFHFAAQLYFELNQTAVAEKAWRKSVSLPSPNSGPFAGMAQLLIGEGREVEAIQLLEQAHSAGIESAETFLQLAEAYENLGQLSNAQETLNEALREYPEDGAMWLAHGRVLSQLGEYEAAQTSLLNCLEFSGESENVLFLLSTAQLRNGKRELAAETRQRLKRLRDQGDQPGIGFQTSYESALRAIAVNVLVSSAALAENCGQLDEAERLLWRAIQLVPDGSQAYMSLSSVLRKQGRLANAVEVHQQLVKIQPGNLLNYTNLASIALQNGEIELARNTLLAAIEVDPKGVAAQALLAKLYLAEQQYFEAEKYAASVLERNRSVESLLLVASVYQAQGDSGAAQQAIAEARALDPYHPIWKSE